MKHSTFAVKGNVLYSQNKSMIIEQNDVFLVCENGKVDGVYSNLPEKYKNIPVKDTKGNLIVPGFTDLHIHAPQTAFRGMGMDLELLSWLSAYAFPEESKYKDIAYAKKAYSLFVDTLKKGATTRAVVFATAHVPATIELMDMLEETGLITMVGKVNMDRNAIKELQEESAKASLSATEEWLKTCENRYSKTSPALTPRFIPSCTDELLLGLGEIQKRYKLPVQSHLSENMGEIAWVKELCPTAENYADAYVQKGLFGGVDCPTIMAHCVYSDEEEQKILKEKGVWVAHCPTSNTCLASGVAPIRQFLQNDINVGLGSDVAGGYDISIFGAMAEAVKASKLRWRMQDDSLKPLCLEEVFYMATKGGGSFFGKVGSFEAGYDFDAIILDDSNLPCPFELTPKQRLERIMYLGGDQNVMGKYVCGEQVI